MPEVIEPVLEDVIKYYQKQDGSVQVYEVKNHEADGSARSITGDEEGQEVSEGAYLAYVATLEAEAVADVEAIKAEKVAAVTALVNKIWGPSVAVTEQEVSDLATLFGL